MGRAEREIPGPRALHCEKSKKKRGERRAHLPNVTLWLCNENNERLLQKLSRKWSESWKSNQNRSRRNPHAVSVVKVCGFCVCGTLKKKKYQKKPVLCVALFPDLLEVISSVLARCSVSAGQLETFSRNISVLIPFVVNTSLAGQLLPSFLQKEFSEQDCASSVFYLFIYFSSFNLSSIVPEIFTLIEGCWFPKFFIRPFRGFLLSSPE